MIITVAKRSLYLGMTLLGGFAKPFYRLFFVFGNTATVSITPTKIRLSIGMSLLGGFAEPPYSLCTIYGYADTIKIS
jgi:hypothetical protein